MAQTEEDHVQRPGTLVQIDGQFVRDQANNAVRQFFSPITAPFQVAAQSFSTEAAAIKVAAAMSVAAPGVMTKRHDR